MSSTRNECKTRRLIFHIADPNIGLTRVDNIYCKCLRVGGVVLLGSWQLANTPEMCEFTR